MWGELVELEHWDDQVDELREGDAHIRHQEMGLWSKERQDGMSADTQR